MHCCYLPHVGTERMTLHAAAQAMESEGMPLPPPPPTHALRPCSPAATHLLPPCSVSATCTQLRLHAEWLCTRLAQKGARQRSGEARGLTYRGCPNNARARDGTGAKRNSMFRNAGRAPMRGAIAR